MPQYQSLRHQSPSHESRAIEVEMEPARDWPHLGDEWRALEARADCSYFLTWRWIGAWLAELPAEFEPLCLRARAGGETVGLALLVWRRARRRGVIHSKQLHLNATGHLHFDQLSIEYNDFLVDRRLADEARRAMIGQLAEWTELWDELFLDGVDPSFAARLAGIPGQLVLRGRGFYPYVDLQAVPDAECLATLGRNTRHQIRRTYRLCGDPRLEIAADAADAAVFFAGLLEQHKAVWSPRGYAGAFWNDFLLGFHRRLIAEGLPCGEVQLLRTRSGDGRIIGHLYNFIYRGRVYCYQSGFAPFDDNRIKPGLLSHHLAIVMSRANGLRFYDFMAGDSRYKRSLSNRVGELHWMVMQRPALRFVLEQRLRSVKRRLGDATRRFRGLTPPRDDG